MLRSLMYALALLFTPATPEDEIMLSSFDRPTISSWTLTSSPSNNAAFVTSSAYLTDGKVSIPTRFTWDTGTQHNYDAVTFSAAVSIPYVGAADKRLVVAMLCPKTPYAIPVGALITGTIGYQGVISHYVSVSGLTVQFNNGSTGIYLITPTTEGLTDGTINTMQLNVVNRKQIALGGSTWATPGQTLDIGEIWFGTLQEFDLQNDPTYNVIDTTLQRRSHSNVPWPLFQKPYRQWALNFAPMDDTAAWSGSYNFDYCRNLWTQSQAMVILPRVYTPGTANISNADLNQFALFGVMESIQPLRNVSNARGLWTSSGVFGEAPP